MLQFSAVRSLRPISTWCTASGVFMFELDPDTLLKLSFAGTFSLPADAQKRAYVLKTSVNRSIVVAAMEAEHDRILELELDATAKRFRRGSSGAFASEDAPSEATDSDFDEPDGDRMDGADASAHSRSDSSGVFADPKFVEFECSETSKDDHVVTGGADCEKTRAVEQEFLRRYSNPIIARTSTGFSDDSNVIRGNVESDVGPSQVVLTEVIAGGVTVMFREERNKHHFFNEFSQADLNRCPVRR